MPDVISDSSCLIVLDNIDMLFILKEPYGKIYITEEVLNEFGKNIIDWIEIKKVINRNYLRILNNILDRFSFPRFTWECLHGRFASS